MSSRRASGLLPEVTCCRRCSRNTPEPPSSAAWKVGEYMAATASGLRLAHAAAQALTASSAESATTPLRPKNDGGSSRQRGAGSSLAVSGATGGMTRPPVLRRSLPGTPSGIWRRGRSLAVTYAGLLILQGLLVPQPVTSTATASAQKSETGDEIRRIRE